MRVPLQITFAKSPSPFYAHAVRLAQRLPGYRPTGVGKELIHRVALMLSLADEALWQQLRPLLRLVSGWRATAVEVAGQPVRYRRLSSTDLATLATMCTCGSTTSAMS